MKFISVYVLGVIVGFFATMAFVADTCPEQYVCYEPYGEPVSPEYILKGAIVNVRFVDADSLDVDGYAEYELDPDGRPFSWCVITAPMPTQVLGDPAMDTLGHELLHCVTGDFHP